MKENAVLTKEQLLCVMFMSVIGNIVYVHTWVDDYADRAVWVASLVGILAVIPPAALLLRVGRRQGNATLFDLIGSGFGRFAAAAAALGYAAVTVCLASTHVSMFASLLNTFFLQYTPPWFIIIDLVAMGTLFAAGRLTNLVRWIELMAVLGVVNYFATFIVGIPMEFHLEYIVPIFDKPLTSILTAVLFFVGNAAEALLILAVLVGFTPAPETKIKSAAWGIALAGVVFSAAILIINGMMSPELAKRIAYGGVNAARLIQVGNYLQGLEVFILMAYQLIAVSRVALLLFCAWTVLKRLLGGRIPRILLLLVSAAIVVVSLTVVTYNRAFGLAVFAATYLTLPFSVLLILLAALGTIFKQDRFGGKTG